MLRFLTYDFVLVSGGVPLLAGGLEVDDDEEVDVLVLAALEQPGLDELLPLVVLLEPPLDGLTLAVGVQPQPPALVLHLAEVHPVDLAVHEADLVVHVLRIVGTDLARGGVVVVVVGARVGLLEAVVAGDVGEAVAVDVLVGLLVREGILIGLLGLVGWRPHPVSALGMGYVEPVWRLVLLLLLLLVLLRASEKKLAEVSALSVSHGERNGCALEWNTSDYYSDIQNAGKVALPAVNKYTRVYYSQQMVVHNAWLPW